MAQGSQWVPHIAMRVGEGPKNRVGGYSTVNIAVLGHVNIIIIVDEVATAQPLKSDKSGQSQSHVNQKDIHLFGRSLHKQPH
ncbi:unnamed protein product [marine sediment metagenome]|uniref:Uncharacterized protein n=1 Tax=marine sediment metagenome TaxID=412755 RepID=X1N0M5_9ZZZZ